MTLTTTWMLITGRRLDQAPLLHDLTADQLIGFWADDHTGEITLALPGAGKAVPATASTHHEVELTPCELQITLLMAMACLRSLVDR